MQNKNIVIIMAPDKEIIYHIKSVKCVTLTLNRGIFIIDKLSTHIYYDIDI